MILLMTTPPPQGSPWGLPKKLPPLGLLYVGGALEKAGFPIAILDSYSLRKTLDDVKSEVRRLNPDIVGITCGSVTYPECIKAVKAVKEVLPSCKVIVGGWHPSYMPEAMLDENPEIDYAVIGEGERAIVELATCINKGEGEAVLAKIAGIAYRHEGKGVKNAPRFIDNLDEIPYPARHLVPLHLYDRKIEYLDAKPADTINVIRGCPYNCTYCETKELWGIKCRYFSADRIVEELRYMSSKFGTKGVYFIGDNFTINKKRTSDLCEQLEKAKLDMEWVCDTRVDLVSRELLRSMKKAGCKTIFFGIESGSQRILERINKGITLEQSLQAFKICRQEGIQIACSFILGIPGETLKDWEASYKFAKKLDPDWCTFETFVAVPGSALYSEIMEKKLYDRLDGFLAYVKTDDFNYDTLFEAVRRYQRGFNLSRKRIMRKIRRDGLISVLKKSPSLLR